jgi:hypothetical protein
MIEIRKDRVLGRERSGEGTQFWMVEERESSDGYIVEVCLKAALPSA